MSEARGIDGTPAKKRDGYRPVGNLAGGAPLLRPRDPNEPDRSQPFVYDPYRPELSAPPKERGRALTSAERIVRIWTTDRGKKYARENATDLTMMRICILAVGSAPNGYSTGDFVRLVRAARELPSLDEKLIFKQVSEYVRRGYMDVERRI